jgi:hypothetical protein
VGSKISRSGGKFCIYGALHRRRFESMEIGRLVRFEKVERAQVSKKCPSRPCLVGINPRFTRGAGSRIRTEDLLIANQSLSSRAGISVTTFRRKCYEPRKTYTWQQQRNRAHAKCRKVKSRQGRAPVSALTFSPVRLTRLCGFAARAIL